MAGTLQAQGWLDGMAGKRGLAQGNRGARHPSPDRTATPLQPCLARAFDGLTPGPAEWAETGAALGLVPADELCLPQDMPPVSEALRPGLAVAALDVLGEGPGAGVRRAGHDGRAW